MNDKKRILFLTLYPEHHPSTRFRVMQFLPYLGKDTKYVIKPLLPEKFFSIFYSQNSLLEKIFFHTLEIIFRIKDIASSYRYDAVFLQKGITTVNLRFLYRLLFFFNKKIIFDFDDAININRISRISRFPLNLLQDNSEWERLVKLSAAVIVGNEKLANDIRKLNKKICIIPTPVDTNYYQFRPKAPGVRERLVILWSGNKSSHVYFDICAEALRRLAEKYPIEILIFTNWLADNRLPKMFGNAKIRLEKWSVEAERNIFAQADIGIMPLYDTLWDRRKCVFKALLYMSCGIPSVSSSVGVIKNIVNDGQNGFLASSGEEWFVKLEQLIKDPVLRKTLAQNGRKTVEEHFSLSQWGPYWNEIIKTNSLKK